MNLLTIFLLLALTAQPEGLVEAAKDAKKRRGKSTTKVITNEDVRQSKGKLIVTNAEAPPEPQAVEPMTVARHEDQKRKTAAAELRLREAEAKVAAREAEVAALEQRYYNENDLDLRDGEIVRRFDAARTRLAAAVAELEAAKKDPLLDIESPVRVIGADLPADSDPDEEVPKTSATPPPSRSNAPPGRS